MFQKKLSFNSAQHAMPVCQLISITFECRLIKNANYFSNPNGPRARETNKFIHRAPHGGDI